MEPVHGTNKALEDDIISRMPENVITNILDCFPIQDAVGTSILSRNWRFNWTMMTRLVFDEEFFDYLPIDKCRIIISRLLLHIKGPITKFFLDIPDEIFDVEDISHWVMFLSRKGIQDFTLINYDETPVQLPSHLFSCLELKHLRLDRCYFYTPPTFCGFPNLLSLDLCELTDIGGCVEFITKCPLLEILKISYIEPTTGKMKLVEIAKLKNLIELSLPLCILDDVTITSSTIFQLGGYLPKLQVLNLNLIRCKFIEEAGVRKWVSTAFPCLKTLTLSSIDFKSRIMLSCVFEMIWGSPNLQTLKITATYNGEAGPPLVFCFPEIDNNTLQLQLRSVVFESCRGSDNEVYLIKSLLASSPLLQNITIHAKSSQVFGGDNGKLIFATKLLDLDRASPKARVKLCFRL